MLSGITIPPASGKHERGATMRTIQTIVYNFNELSEGAKQHAIEKLHTINTDYEWYDATFDDAKEIGRIMGIDINNIYFSGFSSQGDGACFEGRYEYRKGSVKELKAYAPVDTELHRIAKALQDIQRKAFYRLTAHVKQSGHYNHKYCTVIDVYNSESGDYATDEQSDAITETLRDFMEWIYRTLEKECEYLESEEAIIETIEANEYEFDTAGNLN